MLSKDFRSMNKREYILWYWSCSNWRDKTRRKTKAIFHLMLELNIVWHVSTNSGSWPLLDLLTFTKPKDFNVGRSILTVSIMLHKHEWKSDLILSIFPQKADQIYLRPSIKSEMLLLASFWKSSMSSMLSKRDGCVPSAGPTGLKFLDFGQELNKRFSMVSQ